MKKDDQEKLVSRRGFIKKALAKIGGGIVVGGGIGTAIGVKTDPPQAVQAPQERNPNIIVLPEDFDRPQEQPDGPSLAEKAEWVAKHALSGAGAGGVIGAAAAVPSSRVPEEKKPEWLKRQEQIDRARQIRPDRPREY